MGQLDDYLAALGALPDAKRADVIKDAAAATQEYAWIPNPGPQTEAFFCEADELLYGGEAGGGKTDLVAGLSLTAHKRSLVLRRTNLEAVKLYDRYEVILGSRDGFNEQRGIKTHGRVIDIGGCQLEADKQKRKGIPHDLKAFDELVDFTESQYLFIITWNRTTDPTQRCRIVATTNPPTSPEGMWVVRRWAPWLDPKHPHPAKSGELRWFTTIDGVDTEVDGHGPHMVNGREVRAKSRCFIRSTLADNPDLTRTDDYRSRLDALPEELRVAYAEGRFDVGLKDQPFQAIPTEWIRAAMARWTEHPPPDVPQCAIGVDCSGGGRDPMVMAIRHDGWYSPVVETPGDQIPAERAGAYGAGIIVSHRRGRSTVIVDMGGGYGGPIYERLADNDMQPVPYKGAEATTKRSKDGLLGFTNVRSAAIWRFREALDPDQDGGSPIMLPFDQQMLADLAAPRFALKRDKIEIESKEDVCKRLGRSTDRGDAVVMAWWAGPTYITNAEVWYRDATMRRPLGRTPQVVMGRPNRRRQM